MKLPFKIPKFVAACSVVLVPLFLVSSGIGTTLLDAVCLLLIDIGLIVWMVNRRARSSAPTRSGFAVAALTYAHILTQISSWSGGSYGFYATSLVLIVTFSSVLALLVTLQ